jgi:hypothetical protein
MLGLMILVPNAIAFVCGLYFVFTWAREDRRRGRHPVAPRPAPFRNHHDAKAPATL